jgi:hypothetical protein
MLDRASLSRQAPALRPAQTEEALVSAIMAEQILGDRDALPQLRRLSESDPSLKVRDAARKAVSGQP